MLEQISGKSKKEVMHILYFLYDSQYGNKELKEMAEMVKEELKIREVMIMEKWKQDFVNAIFSREYDDLTVKEVMEKFMPKTTTITIETPEICGKCVFYNEIQYNDHGYSGLQACCKMGYMIGDMRDRTFKNTKYELCEIGQKNLQKPNNTI